MSILASVTFPIALCRCAMACPMASIAELIAHGAVGDLAGHFLNARGVPLDHTINRQVLAPELFSLSKIRHRLVVGGAPTRYLSCRPYWRAARG